MVKFGERSKPSSKDRQLEHKVLFNHLILENILAVGEFGLADLKVFRQVSGYWYERSLALWRSKAVLNLAPAPELRGKRRRTRNTGTVGQNFLPFTEYQRLWEEEGDTFYSFSKLPYVQVQLLMWTIDAEDKVTNRFWTVVGPSFKHVHFSHCVFTKSPSLTICSRTLPNLESFVVNLCKCGTDPLLSHNTPDRRLPLSTSWPPGQNGGVKSAKIIWALDKAADWVHLMTNFANLENLELVGRGWKYVDISLVNNMFWDLLLRSTVELHQRAPLHSLKSLQMIDSVEGCVCNWGQSTHNFDDQLVRLNAPLESLGIDVGFETRMGKISRVLQVYSGTLRTINIFRAPFSPPTLVSFPYDVRLEHVTKISIWGDVVTGFEFLHNVPNLECLEIDKCCFSKKAKLVKMMCLGRKPIYWNRDIVQMTLSSGVMRNMSWSSFTSLRIDYAFRKESLRQLAKWFPALSTFNTILNNETLSLCCQLWAGLTELVLLFGSCVDDTGITGRESRLQPQTSPGVAQLSSLRSFTLQVFCHRAKLTDFSGDAFLQLPKLSHLELCVSKQMSKGMEARLKEQINSVRLIRNYGVLEGGDKHEYECCDRMNYLNQIGFFNLILSNKAAKRPPNSNA